MQHVKGLEARDAVDLLSSPECSVSAAPGTKRGAVRSTPASPDPTGMQPAKGMNHSGTFGCISPTWQQEQQHRSCKLAVGHGGIASEEQPGWVGATPHSTFMHMHDVLHGHA